MSKLIHGANAVRLVVLLTVLSLGLVWLRLSSAPPVTMTPQADPVPRSQVVVPGVALVPVATPAPAHAVPAHPRSKARHVRARHRRHLRQLRRERLRRAAHHAARRHHAPNRWLHAGGRDIGWPQCPHDVGNRGGHGLDQPMPEVGVRFVIVGLSNGSAFTPNPCLPEHLRWVRAHHVWAAPYAFATYPTRPQLRRFGGQGPFDGTRFLGSLRNAGNAAARYNIGLMRALGFTSPHIWLDLEPSSTRPWSGRRAWNRAVVQGWVRAYHDAGYSVGFYSTRLLWHHILGNLRLGVPEWRTAGPVSPSAAGRACRGASFQGGPAVIAQWWTAHRDFDRLCPSASRDAVLSQFFHKW